MHVHGAHLNPNATNLYSAVAAEKTAAAKRAAEVRKKLLSNASEIEGEAEIQATSMTAEENEEDSPPGHNHKRPAKKKNAAEEGPPDDPISVWG